MNRPIREIERVLVHEGVASDTELISTCDKEDVEPRRLLIQFSTTSRDGRNSIPSPPLPLTCDAFPILELVH